MKALTLTQFELENETGAYVLDFRPADQFIDSFVPGSFFISARFIKSNFGKEIISTNETIIFITPDSFLNQSIKVLENAGYENTLGWLKGGFITWEASGNKVDVIISIEPDELMMDMKYDNPQIIDIRSEEAFEAMHLEEAENIPVENLLFNLDDLPKDGIFYMYCEDGELSLSVISCLKSQGLHNYYHIKGGFRALHQAEAKMATR
jgi:hydroxyacylglutathione hydrolase